MSPADMTDFDDFGRDWDSDASGAPVPNGNYDVIIENAEAWLRPSDGARFSKVYLRVTHGPFAGTSVEHFMNWNNPVGKKKAKESVKMYGLRNPGTWDQFELRIVDLCGTTANVSVSQNGDFTNVDVNSSAQPPPQPIPGQTAMPAPAAAAAGASDDDDLPF